jgi:hypothetical protein
LLVSGGKRQSQNALELEDSQEKRGPIPSLCALAAAREGYRYRLLLRPRQGSRRTTLRDGAEAAIRPYPLEGGGPDRKTLRQGNEPDLQTSPRFKPAQTLRTYLAGPEQKFLFTFFRRAGVPPTNNHAEQPLRHLAIFRKIGFGTRSDNGLKTHSILPSLVQTAEDDPSIRGSSCNPLTADTATAQAALYPNSS